jgi:lipopolysaccharide/colanic/teichoic acid biosynthesis glycosyltransferase
MKHAAVKRCFDIALALIGGFFLFPIFCVIGILLLLKQGRPVFYMKKSLGKDKKVFNAIKFRSMHINSLKITSFGKILRQTAIDELPQLINIIKGDMSFVGPRSYAVDKYTPERPEFFKRLRVVPGLTGMAQLLAAKHADTREVLYHDLEYIKNQSLKLDIEILCVSVYITLRRSWEKESAKIHTKSLRKE